MTATRFKAGCLAVLDDVERTGEPVVILKRGKSVAQVVRIPAGRGRRPQDGLRGSVEIVGDITSPVVPADAWNAERRSR